MVRTQIYLTEREHRSLDSLAKANSCSKSEIIRKAVDEFVSKSSHPGRLEALRKARGIWKGRKELPDIRAMRRAWRRRSWS
ncbi:MAG: CopG family transcriptional regulator [Verrucomicrobia bacterium]|nr:MAG: CopG family transcriptional regulator [Verrucomicrobiota bacterium]